MLDFSVKTKSETLKDFGQEESLASSVFQTLEEWGCSHIFLVPGAQIDGFGEALAGTKKPFPIVACHELAAGYMADGYYRASGRVGVAMAIGGPGAANFVGAAATASSDASSVVFVTGNIPATFQGRGEFQDAWPTGTNDAAIFQAAIGESIILSEPGKMLECLSRTRARLEKKQPAHLMVPLDVQRLRAPKERAEIEPELQEPFIPAMPDWLVNGRLALFLGERALDFIDAEKLLAWVKRWNVPVMTNAAARGILPEISPYSLGHIGFMSHPRALAALGNIHHLKVESLICVGIDGSSYRSCIDPAIQQQAMDPRVFNTLLATDFEVAATPGIDERLQWLVELRRIEREPRPGSPEGSTITLPSLVNTLKEALPSDTIYCIDSGQARKAAIAHLHGQMPRTILSADGLSPMGWGIAAAIGAKLARPERTVIALTGDGSMRMHGMEIATAARYQLPVLFVVCDNQGYGSIIARQRNQRELAALPPVDWCAFAAALGVPARCLESLRDLPQVLAAFHQSNCPMLIHVEVPLLEVGASQDTTGIAWLE